MKVLIIGGAGMVGRKLAERLASDGRLGERAVSEMTLYDVVAAAEARRRQDAGPYRERRSAGGRRDRQARGGQARCDLPSRSDRVR